METPGFNYFAIIVLLTSGESKAQVSSPFPEYFAETTSLPEEVTKTTNYFGLVEQNVNIYSGSTAATNALTTIEPEIGTELTSNIFSPVPQRPETTQFPELPQSANADVSEVNVETNSINEILTEDDAFFSNNPVTLSPEIENSVKDVQSTEPTPPVESQVTTFDATKTDSILDQIESSNINKDFTSKNEKGLAPWKTGVISAAAFLVVEIVVLMIYCFVCRKKRRAIITNTCEQDSEAGDTINVESNDNTVIREAGTLNCSTLPLGVDYQLLGVQQGEERTKTKIIDTVTENRSTDV